jgi:hypothetical protein
MTKEEWHKEIMDAEIKHGVLERMGEILPTRIEDRHKRGFYITEDESKEAYWYNLFGNKYYLDVVGCRLQAGSRVKFTFKFGPDRNSRNFDSSHPRGNNKLRQLLGIWLEDDRKATVIGKPPACESFKWSLLGKDGGLSLPKLMEVMDGFRQEIDLVVAQLDRIKEHSGLVSEVFRYELEMTGKRKALRDRGIDRTASDGNGG